MFCGKCGANVPGQSTFCPKCGNRIVPDAKAPAPAAAPTQPVPNKPEQPQAPASPAPPPPATAHAPSGWAQPAQTVPGGQPAATHQPTAPVQPPPTTQQPPAQPPSMWAQPVAPAGNGAQPQTSALPPQNAPSGASGSHQISGGLSSQQGPQTQPPLQANYMPPGPPPTIPTPPPKKRGKSIAIVSIIAAALVVVLAVLIITQPFSASPSSLSASTAASSVQTAASSASAPDSTPSSSLSESAPSSSMPEETPADEFPPLIGVQDMTASYGNLEISGSFTLEEDLANVDLILYVRYDGGLVTVKSKPGWSTEYASAGQPYDFSIDLTKISYNVTSKQGGSIPIGNNGIDLLKIFDNGNMYLHIVSGETVYYEYTIVIRY